MAMIFISGAAGVGKTTVVDNLRRRLPREKYALHDIDESDLWTHDYPAWRAAKVDYWLQRSKSNNETGMDTVLSGIVSPKVVADVPTFSAELPIKYVLLHAAPEVLASRLISKLGTEEERAEFDEERIRQMKEFVDGHLAKNKKLLEAFESCADAEVIDTTNSAPDEVCERVRELLLELKD